MIGLAPSFQDVFDGTGTPMLVADDDAVYRDVNAAACRVLGRERGDVIGMRMGVFTPDARRQELDAVWRTFLRERTMTLVRPLRLRDGIERNLPLLFAADLAGPGRHVISLLEPALQASPLSQRQQEVVGLLVDGLSGAEIARRLWLSPETVRTHIRNAMERTGAHTRPQLVAVALRDRLLDAA